MDEADSALRVDHILLDFDLGDIGSKLKNALPVFVGMGFFIYKPHEAGVFTTG